MLFQENESKRYYTISEVAKQFGVSKSLVRFWEAEFDNLKPHKNSKGERRFTQENLDQFRIIHHLVKERGFTLAGAKQEIKLEKDRLLQKMDTIRRLQKVKEFLVELREKV